jgi:hypothetical protein
MIRINTNLKKLTHKEMRSIVEKTVKYSKENIGINKRRGVCNIIVKNQSINDDGRRYGEYKPDTHTIIIFKNNCKNIKELITTTLHEYVHNLQPVRSKYYKMLKTYGYDNHPMEIEAIGYERFYGDVWKTIKNK